MRRCPRGELWWTYSTKKTKTTTFYLSYGVLIRYFFCCFKSAPNLWPENSEGLYVFCMDIINNSGPSGTLGGCASIHWLKNQIKHLMSVQFFSLSENLWETTDCFWLISLFPQTVPPWFYRSIKCEQATERCTLIVSATFRAWCSLCRYSARCFGAVNENAFANHNLLRAASVSVHVTGTRPSTWPRWTCPHFFGWDSPNSTLNCNICLILSWKLNGSPWDADTLPLSAA